MNTKKNIWIVAMSAFIAAIMTSCGGSKTMIVPRAVNTACAVSLDDLNMTSKDYVVLNTISAKSSVICKYGKDNLSVESTDGNYAYKFSYDSNYGWKLDSFKGLATFGYLYKDILQSDKDRELLEVEKFARLGATANLIEAMKDYGADGVIEPVVTTRVSNIGKNTYEYSCTVRAKLVVVKNSK